jgi:DNA uptake protein ComE-like DNA-binding protein
VKPLRKIISELVGFDRRERRGTFILSLLLLLLLLIRIFSFRTGTETVNTDILTDNVSLPEEGKSNEVAEMFVFDPNTASYDELLRLGLTERQAGTLINYRSSGARFRKPGDIYRVYGIDSAKAAILVPWVRITVAEVKSEARAVDEYKAEAGVKVKVKVTGEYEEPDIVTDINLCSAADLIRLPGIGPVLSERIVKYRGLLGGFVSTGQLREVYGLDSAVFNNIEHMLTVTFDSVTPLLLDSCSFSELARHPYLGSEAAGLIMKYRSLMGCPVTLGELVNQRLLTPQQATRIAPYVRPSPGLSGDGYEFISSKVLK